MYTYDFDKLNQLFSSLIEQHVNELALPWIKEKAEVAQGRDSFNKFPLAFAMVTRKVKNEPLNISGEIMAEISSVIPKLSISHWSVRRLVRVWLVMQINASDKDQYTKQIKSLFSNADMNELATLYASLPILAYAEYWREQCAEGIRSNIGYVLDAVIMDNPYPAEYLDEEAWNQLVLKAFFTEKDISRIVGLKERVNEKLVKALQDYADERSSAGREINPKLWEIVNLMPQ
ncbi:EboA domain-containing protein [Albibacterium profundi]|uniref:EboA domain-containing protein n=1 Tax=Albibacterium profundi TaxID=3134906 RepID=A0ABV5C9U5_9SPHI